MRKKVIAAVATVVVVGAGTATALALVGGAAAAPVAPSVAPPAGDNPDLTVMPTSGPAGTVVTISNSNSCFGGAATATVTLHDPSNQQASDANVDGDWSVQITVAAGTPAATYQITATCTGADEVPVDYDYNASSFTVVAASPSPTPSPSKSPSPSPSPSASPSPQASPATAVKGTAHFTG